MRPCFTALAVSLISLLLMAVEVGRAQERSTPLPAQDNAPRDATKSVPRPRPEGPAPDLPQDKPLFRDDAGPLATEEMQAIVERAQQLEEEENLRQEAAIAEAVAAFDAKRPKYLADIQVQPPAAFPDNPPPHEGALIDLPILVEPPDLLVVEVLEALPGRPITGERLVRPDGTISLGFYGAVHVRGLTPEQIKIKVILHLLRTLNHESLGVVGLDANEKGVTVDPVDSERVMVDVSAYNSKAYFVEGEVSAPGRLPVTGRETVLDALNFVGGLLPSADREKVALVRPARGGTPARTYAIDLEAIAAGDVTANLQVLPGDRLLVPKRADATALEEQERAHAERKRQADELRWTREFADTYQWAKERTPPAGQQALANAWDAFRSAWRNPTTDLADLRARQRAWLGTLLDAR